MQLKLQASRFSQLESPRHPGLEVFLFDTAYISYHTILVMWRNDHNLIVLWGDESAWSCGHWLLSVSQAKLCDHKHNSACDTKTLRHTRKGQV